MGFDHFDGLAVAAFVMAAMDSLPWWPFWLLFAWCSLWWIVYATIAAVKA
jgi:hypothetical protein